MSDLFNVETVVIAILATQGGLPAAQHYDSNTDTVSTVERLSVKCSPPTDFFKARAPYLPPVLHQAVLTVEYQVPTSLSLTTYDNNIASIDVAMTSPQSGAVEALALSLFPQGMGIDNPDGGDKQNVGSEVRSYTRTFRAFWAPTAI
jgi:hypothetical protein